MQDAHKELQASLSQSFGLSWSELIAPEQIIAALAVRIEQLIASNPDQLFSMLYRMDISEKKIKEAMKRNKAIAHKIAALVYERQLEKIISRKRFPGKRPDDELAW